MSAPTGPKSPGSDVPMPIQQGQAPIGPVVSPSKERLQGLNEKATDLSKRIAQFQQANAQPGIVPARQKFNEQQITVLTKELEKVHAEQTQLGYGFSHDYGELKHAQAEIEKLEAQLMELRAAEEPDTERIATYEGRKAALQAKVDANIGPMAQTAYSILQKTGLGDYFFGSPEKESPPKG